MKKGIYYHLTSIDNLESILKNGLIRANAKSSSFDASHNGKPIYFAKTKSAALHLAPIATGYLFQKTFFDSIKMQFGNYLHFEKMFIETVMLKCDLSGLENQLVKSHQIYSDSVIKRMGPGCRNTYVEYLLYQDLRPERIVSYETVKFVYQQPVAK